MSNEKRHITLHLYNRELSVNAPVDDEEYYRKAAKRITDTVNTYASIFHESILHGKKDEKDILYMAMFDIALHYEKETSRNDTEPFMDILTHLTSEIEEALKPKKK